MEQLRARLEALAPGEKYLLIAERRQPGHLANPSLAEYLGWHGLEDRILVRGFGGGVELPDFPDIKCMSLDPDFFEEWITETRDGKLVVPVTHKVPASVMGSGLGRDNAFRGDYDITMFDPQIVAECGLDTLRLGDLVAIIRASAGMGALQTAPAVGFLITTGVLAPMAAVMAAGMTPPLGLALATVLRKKLFTVQEQEAGKAAWVMGASFITEGAIPFAAADPIRVIPALMLGSAITGALSMAFGATLQAPHGGIWVFGLVTNWPLYILAIAIGTVVTAVAVLALKSFHRPADETTETTSTTEAAHA